MSLAIEALRKHGPLAAVLILLMSAFTTVTMTIIREQGRKIEALSAQVNGLAVRIEGIDNGQEFLSRMIDMACEPKEEDRPTRAVERANR